MDDTRIRGILLDVEGTTSSISFVYDVMFPYVRENVAPFLRSSWNEPAVQNCLPLLAADLEKPLDWLQEMNEQEQQTQVVCGVIGLMDADVKATGLKQLQGLIWENGFQSGQLVAHLFADVAPALRQWHANGIDLRIYSSGSIHAQRLFFGHTIAGSLTPLLNGHYDTTTGPKQEPDSYRKIAREFDCPAHQILFVSDVIAELEAAQAAGLKTVLSLRAGNKPVTDGHGFESVESFAQIEIGCGLA